jgi:hypothetical protein
MLAIRNTFSIHRLSTSDSALSPFNVSTEIRNPNFTIEETKTLFSEFARDRKINTDSDVIDDVWGKSGGYVALCSSLSV